MTQILLFDIDGTLVLTGGAGGRAMTRAFEDLFQVTDAFRGIPMPGRTDLVILTDAAARAGIALDPPRLLDFRERYCTYLHEEILTGGPRKGVMPGVRPLLEALQRRAGTVLALLTGNYEAAARIKLQHFDLWRYFACGAYGDEAADRNGLVPVALERIKALNAPPSSSTHVVVIGDTPHDVACARAAGARAMAVATGSHDLDELAACRPDAVVPDLSDVAGVLRLLDDWAGAPAAG